MAIRQKPHATGKVKAGDVTQRVGVEQLEPGSTAGVGGVCPVLKQE